MGLYVSSLLNHRKGIDKPLEKVGEEATEFVLAVKNGDADQIAAEGADLLFHFLVALKASGVDLADGAHRARGAAAIESLVFHRTSHKP